MEGGYEKLIENTGYNYYYFKNLGYSRQGLCPYNLARKRDPLIPHYSHVLIISSINALMQFILMHPCILFMDNLD